MYNIKLFMQSFLAWNLTSIKSFLFWISMNCAHSCPCFLWLSISCIFHQYSEYVQIRQIKRQLYNKYSVIQSYTHLSSVKLASQVWGFLKVCPKICLNNNFDVHTVKYRKSSKLNFELHQHSDIIKYFQRIQNIN